MSSFSNAPHSKRDFDLSRGERHPARTQSVTATASAELDNSDQQIRAQDAHVRAWRDEERRLAHMQDAIPEFDLGSRGHRDLMRDYEERAFLWDERGSAIERHHAERRALIRENGHTLSNEFRAQRHVRPERMSPYLANHDQGRELGRKR